MSDCSNCTELRAALAHARQELANAAEELRNAATALRETPQQRDLASCTNINTQQAWAPTIGFTGRLRVEPLHVKS